MQFGAHIYARILFAFMLLAVLVSLFMMKNADAQPTAILPTITVTSVTTGAAVQIIAFNPSRRSFQICTATNPIWFAPVNPASMTAVTPASGTGITIAAGACFTPPSLITASGTSGGMGAAIQAIATGGTATVSVLEF